MPPTDSANSHARWPLWSTALAAGLLAGAAVAALALELDVTRARAGLGTKLERAGEALVRGAEAGERIAAALGGGCIEDDGSVSTERFLAAAAEVHGHHPEILAAHLLLREPASGELSFGASFGELERPSAPAPGAALDDPRARWIAAAYAGGAAHLAPFTEDARGGLIWSLVSPITDRALVLLQSPESPEFAAQVAELERFRLVLDRDPRASFTFERPAQGRTDWRLPVRDLQAELLLESPLGQLELAARRAMRLSDLSLLTRIVPLLVGLLVACSTYALRRMLAAERAASLRLTVEQEQALRAEVLERKLAEQRFQDIARSAGEYLWELDATGAFTYLTELAVEVLGLPLEALLGRRPTELMPEGEREQIETWFEGLVEQPRDFAHLEHRTIRGDGRVIWQRVSGVPVLTESGALAGFRGTALDITEQREATDRALSQRHELQLILDALPAMIFYKDDSNRILRVNRSAAEAMGGAPESFEGAQTESLFPPELASAYLQDDLEVLRSRRPKLGIVENFAASSGAMRCLRTDKVPLPGPDGRLTRLVAIARDITEERLKDRKLELAVAAAGMGMWDWDLVGDSLELSEEWFHVLGLDPAEHTHDFRTWLEHMHPEDRERTRNAVTGYLRQTSGERFRVEHRLRDGTGSYRWVEAIGEVTQRDDRGRALRCSGVLLDTHARRQFEDELRAAQRAAEAANRSKSEFLANMSHEIRTPMGAILGFADLLSSPECTQAEREAHVATIQRNGEHLLSLLGDILDLSKIEAGRLSLSSVPCSAVLILNEVLEMLRPEAEHKGLELLVTIDPDVPAFLRTDPLRFRQVLVNIIGNAIKFTSVGKVEVDADWRADRLRIAVVDTGPGLDALQRKRIFEAFAQADESTTRRFGGTGLGLAISRRLARMLGGDLVVTSKPGIGSSFTATFGAQAAAPSGAARPASAGSAPPLGPETGPADAAELPLAGRHVLLVEDGRDNQLLISRFLQRSGATVEFAANGLLAVERLGQESSGPSLDLVLMDMQMPVLDGYAATTKLRELGLRLPIIALTAHAMVGDKELCLEAGCDEYLTKPVKREQLVETCLAVLRRQAA